MRLPKPVLFQDISMSNVLSKSNKLLLLPISVFKFTPIYSNKSNIKHAKWSNYQNVYINNLNSITKL